ncbi:nucleotidyl transferase AbiEii/AbiGii toxin family protein [Arenimonas sp.]|uniref:nucleotidyl transferase AbiEii/AbiGii toxin family protein n=1 Tax=Arenimonas sp. TaxID=1872635 RepID=UPI002E303081|nr:nucleotidyl transferase AbiEii/AbiGii toxin family protein [Arenimonas sp.]HEX4854051.1 nucleotidyl transferase AbiEii/AbiGii toxin family protein [Arenimonas sp.]
MDRRYADRVALLVAVLPQLAREPDFALKGGTAINLFEHDLPRLSVDIDLGWLRTQSFDEDATLIRDALGRLADTLAKPPLKLDVALSRPAGAGTLHRIVASRRGAQVQIETSPVMRGTVHPTRTMLLQPSIERQYGFASTQVFHFADLYAGKMAAALSRQHPRDLFDVRVLLGTHGISDELWRTFLVYLTASPKPAVELLDPAIPVDFDRVFTSQFEGMTREAVKPGDLLEARIRFLREIRRRLDGSSCEFLLSVEQERADFTLIGLPQAAALPGIRWKLRNLEQRDESKRSADLVKLKAFLGQVSGG